MNKLVHPVGLSTRFEPTFKQYSPFSYNPIQRVLYIAQSQQVSE